MLPDGWIPHRRSDGEVIGWLEIVGDDVVAHDLLGRRVTAPGVDWHEAEQALEERGIGYLADQYTLTTEYGEFLPVRIGEATTDRVTVVEDEFGGASVIGAEPASYELPFPVPLGRLRDYVRPQLDLGTWLDAAGRPIAYGDRWDISEDPPDELYSECAHPERFEPLIATTRALLDYLERRYDVERTEEVMDEQTSITLTPRSGEGASLTVILSRATLPGVEVHAGHLYRGVWPDCGCDGCDDAVPDLLHEIEATVFSVVEGRMSEWRTRSDEGGWAARVRFAELMERDSWIFGKPDPLVLPTTPHRWGPWPLRG